MKKNKKKSISKVMGLEKVNSDYMPNGIWYNAEKDIVLEVRGKTFFDGQDAVKFESNAQIQKIYGKTFLFLED